MDLEEYSLASDVPAHIHVHKGKVADLNCKGMIRNLPTPTPQHFAVEKAHLFKEQWQRRQRLGAPMFVLVERRGTDEPDYAEVRCVDGSVIVLKSPLSITPREGAIVCLMLGYQRKFIDTRAAEKLEKLETVWI